MPTLAAEANVYPENLFKDDFDAKQERCWWAIYTKARQEKALARQLLAYEIPFYLPLVPNENLIRGQKVFSYLPLFAGYVFLFGSDDERVKSLTTNRISRILPVQDQDRLHRDLSNVDRLIACDAPLTVERRLASGRRVRIKSGLMKGVEGTVVSRRGRTRLLVSVNFLQQGASVEIDDFQLEPIN
jgi:transcriptional antiterminator RfaH